MSAIMNFIERNMEYIEIELIVAFLIDVNLLHKYTHGRDWLYIYVKKLIMIIVMKIRMNFLHPLFGNRTIQR